MKTFLKQFEFPIVLIIVVCLSFFIGFKTGKHENEYIFRSREIDSLKSIISNNQNIAKLDTIFIQGIHTIDTIKIYYKIKQNEAKNDTSVTTIISKFEYLLSKNRNRADKRSK